MKSVIKKYLKRFMHSQQKGAALIVSLLVMLVLVLLGLSLVMQSNTEHQIAKNEQDAFQTLANGEAALELSDRKIRNWIDSFDTPPPNLTPVLMGTLAGGGTPNILGFRSFNPGLTVDQLTDINEETTSALYNDGTNNWEVFRMGIDADNNGEFDPETPRTLLYARVEDNFDLTQDTTDEDLRIRVVVDAEYPVFVDGNGDEITNNVAVRPRAKRRLYGRFWPGGHYAIRTDGDLEIWGSTQLCGECGSSHANGLMRAARSAGDDISVCGEATGTGDFEQNGGTIVGDSGLSPPIFIPVINPYHPQYVPDQGRFGQSVTLRDSSPGPIYNLTCPAPSATDPGSSKYFAFVRNTTGPNRMAQVWKAYPDTTNTAKWYWRLIDEKYAPGTAPTGVGDEFSTVLDNCGRVVFCNPDVSPTCAADLNATPGSGVDDGGPGEFYGWDPNGNYGDNTCTGDNISGTASNDNYKNDFNHVSSANPLTISGTAVSTRSCGGVACPAAVPPLPGTGIGDTNADFQTGTVLSDVNWSVSGSKVYSPLYGAVIFVYGDVSLGGNLSNIVFNDGACSATSCLAGAQQDIDLDETVPANTWRISIISYGHVDVGGGVQYSPAFGSTGTFPYAIVAGRDINLHGNNNNYDCNTTDCDGPPSGTNADYAGIFVSHEQIDFAGNVGLNGFIVAEDRVDCDNFVTPSGGNLANQGHGSIQIHYDCSNPFDPWAAKGVKLREWEEVQR